MMCLVLFAFYIANALGAAESESGSGSVATPDKAFVSQPIVGEEIPDKKLEVKPRRMPLSSAVALFKKWEEMGVAVWVDGGFGVDALLGQETRPHGDLDIALEKKDMERVVDSLQNLGYREIERESPWNFVMADDEGHEVDFHVFVLGIDGQMVDGVPYPARSLEGRGVLGGQAVRCIAPTFMVQFHTGYPQRESDSRDVRALCEKFDIDYPEEYRSKM